MVHSQKLKHLVEKFKQLKYSHNTFNSKMHEQGVEKIITDNGFVLMSKNKLPTTKTQYYLNQPNGSQNPPDFKVFDGKSFIDIECKSKKTGYKPMWNSSMPKHSTIYVFTNKKDDKTLIIKGKNIITTKLKTILNNYKKKTKLLENEYNSSLKKLSENDNPYKIGVYARNMFVQNKHFDKKITEKSLKS